MFIYTYMINLKDKTELEIEKIEIIALDKDPKLG